MAVACSEGNLAAEEGTERIVWSRAAGLPGAELLSVENNTRSWRVHHQTYTFCNLTRVAHAEWTYRRKTYSGTTGGLMLMEPGEVHANTQDPPSSDFRVLWIDPLQMERAALEYGLKGGKPALKTGYTQAAGLYDAFLQLHATIDRPSSPLEQQSRLAHCMRLFLQSCVESVARAPAPPGRAALVRARDFIREHYADAVTLDQLSAIAGMSRFHLVRAFAREFGVPPHAFQIQVQISVARRLLSLGKPPSVVAAETGFADQSHFTRHFRRICGVTPGQYQRGGSATSPQRPACR